MWSMGLVQESSATLKHEPWRTVGAKSSATQEQHGIYDRRGSSSSNTKSAKLQLVKQQHREQDGAVDQQNAALQAAVTALR